MALPNLFRNINCVYNKDQKNSDGDQSDINNKYNEPRLQRTRAQSRKIFRFRQSRRMEVSEITYSLLLKISI